MSTCETERLPRRPSVVEPLPGEVRDEIVSHLHAHDTGFHNMPLYKDLEMLPRSFVSNITSNMFGFIIDDAE